MRVLLVSRLMTGFVGSVRDQCWQPAGTPAIRFLIEALDKRDWGFRLIFTRVSAGPEEANDLEALRGRTVPMSGLGTSATFLMKGPGSPPRLARYLRELLHAFWLWREARRQRPSLVYVDRSNVFAGAVLARATKIPVLLRMLGVPPDLHGMLDDRRFGAWLGRWAYRAPFAFVLCTREGSGGGNWMQQALDPAVPREVVLNGVDPPAVRGAAPGVLAEIPEDRMVVTLLGRVERLKGSDLFIDAILALPEAYRSRVHALVVGSGALLAALQERVSAASADGRVTFTGAIPHDHIGHALSRTDVYVSLNRQGHLSNATLEAMSAGLCLVVQRTKPDGVPDEEFEAVVPSEAVVQLSKEAGPEELAMALCRLADDPERRRALTETLRKATADALWSWDDRMAYEIDLIERLASRGAD